MIDRTRGGTQKLPWTALLVLAGGMFVSMTSEFLPAGLIPQIADDFGRSASEVGLLVTAFAGIVVVSTIPIGWLTRRVSRKFIVVVALAGIGFATLLAAFAPTFEVLVVARLVAGLAHGLFWSVAAAYAAHLVPAAQLGRASSVTAGGGSLAGIVGIPLGNALGHSLGWRPAFAAITILACLLVVATAALLPEATHSREEPQGSIRRPRHNDPALARVAGLCFVLLILIVGATSYGTFGVLWLEDVGGLSTSEIPLILFGSGLAGAIGLAITARISDRYPTSTLLGALAAIIVVHLALGVLGGAHRGALVALVILSGLFWGTVPTLLQARIMQASSARLRGLASAIQTTSINVGIGTGALVGGLIINTSGLRLLPILAGFVMLAAGAALILPGAVARASHPPGEFD